MEYRWAGRELTIQVWLPGTALLELAQVGTCEKRFQIQLANQDDLQHRAARRVDVGQQADLLEHVRPHVLRLVDDDDGVGAEGDERGEKILQRVDQIVTARRHRRPIGRHHPEVLEHLLQEVVPLDQIEGAISDALGRIFGIFDALAAVAVLIAALGIANTLTVNVIERVREIGILRAAGMTRRQVWRSVVVEAGILGLAGALLGIVLGLVVGALMVLLAGGQLDIATGIPWSIIGLALVLGVAVAMVAAAYPARIASRLSIVRAVQYE